MIRTLLCSLLIISSVGTPIVMQAAEVASAVKAATTSDSSILSIVQNYSGWITLGSGAVGTLATIGWNYYQKRQINRIENKIDAVDGNVKDVQKTLTKHGKKLDDIHGSVGVLDGRQRDFNKLQREVNANVKGVRDSQKKMQATMRGLSIWQRVAVGLGLKNQKDLKALRDEVQENHKDTKVELGKLQEVTAKIKEEMATKAQVDEVLASLKVARGQVSASTAFSKQTLSVVQDFALCNNGVVAPALAAYAQASDRSSARPTQSPGDSGSPRQAESKTN